MTALQLLSACAPYILRVVGLTVAVIFGTCLVFVVAWTVYMYRVYNKYRHLPGPKVAHFYSGHVMNVAEGVRSGKLIFGDLLVQWCQEYGPIFVLFFFTRVLVVVCSPEGVKEFVIQAKHPKDRISYTRLKMLVGERFMGTGLVSERDHGVWSIRRAIIDPAFHRRYLKQSMSQFNRSSDLMIKRLLGKADGVAEVTMLDELNKVTLDVIAKVSFSCELDIMVDGLSPFTDAVRVTLDALGSLNRAPWLEYSPLKAHRERRKQIHDCCKLLRSFGEKCIRERLAAIQRGEEVPADTLTYIINATGQLSHNYYSMQNMVDDFVTFFVAGQETTANLLTSCFLELLGKQPEVLYRLKNEVESVIGDKNDVAFEDLPKLEYMTAVLKETLRLYPPAGGTLRQTVEEVYLNNVRIPAETSVLISIYAISRLEEHYTDALQYDPDRFMHQDEHILFSFLPFSLGPRMCIGKNFAMIEAKVLLCKLLTSFDFSLVPDQSFDMVTHGTLRPTDGCKVTLKPKIN
ncbi:cholesterol 24-hydroxylase-like [Acanthaster planci]|uniref:Cholesterol 24-hydroxylase-like n=1 Tax=Acanthaster planci TaxID=133434 RepID=A0A8B7Y8R9_ACAPL|nr:cholesterol 24-hydroxylase-like [Acanthaster planci]